MCESVVILLSAVISLVDNYNESKCHNSVKMKPKDPVWNFYSALDDEKRLLGAWTVMQKSVLRS